MEWIWASAREVADGIRSRRVSAREVVEACLARIDEVNPRLNAVVQVTAESALAAARGVDAALERGERLGPLAGVPMTIKDSHDVAGVVSTGGTTGRRSFVPEKDASVVARVREAGAVLLGKTNTPELTMSFETDNLIYGRTSNPWDPTRTSGGSSGGAAAIVASGGSAFDVGTDTGGSIRVPSHFCGIAGLKPTSGRVPRTGHVWPWGGLVDALTTVGPMARRVEDLALLLPILAGVDWCDPFVAPVPLGSPDEVDLSSLRVAFHTDNGIAAPTAETAAAVEAAVEALALAGASVEEVRPPGVERSLELFMAVIGADGGAQIRALLERAGTTEFSPALANLTEEAGAVPDAHQTWRIIDAWDGFRSGMLGFMRDRDAIVCPVNAGPAVPHGGAFEVLDRFSYTMTHNLTGYPAAVVRAGTAPEGLPIGVQLVARPWREDVALAMAFAVERATGGFTPPSTIG